MFSLGSEVKFGVDSIPERLEESPNPLPANLIKRRIWMNDNMISRLLATYENGKMSRRDLVQGLALLTASAGTMSAAGFQGSSINHVSMQVSDLKKSTDFY